MEPRIKKIQYVNNHVFNITFEDGKHGKIDFKTFLWGEAFEKIKQKKYFKKAYINEITGTITWPNGVDLSPETLYKSLESKST
jgi:hypothetical protein